MYYHKTTKNDIDKIIKHIDDKFSILDGRLTNLESNMTLIYNELTALHISFGGISNDSKSEELKDVQKS